MRSGFMKSAIAAPSLRNSGLETTSNSTFALRFASALATSALTLSAVPTGTVDLVTTIVYLSMCSPMVRATASTWRRSAEPSSSGGVPTAMRLEQAVRDALGRVGGELQAAGLAVAPTISSRPGSWIGTSPLFSRATLPASTSTQTHVVAHLGEAGAGDQAHVTGAENRYFHALNALSYLTMHQPSGLKP